MRTLALQTIILLALFFFSHGSALAQETEGSTSFNEISGKVVDSSGKPIEAFSVVLTVYDYTEGGWNKPPKTVKKWEGEFENGEFRFDVDGPIPFNQMTYLSRQVKAEGFLVLGNSGYQPLGYFAGKFATQKLARAIKVTGKVVLPDGHEEEEIADPRLIVAKRMGSVTPDYNKVFQAGVFVKEDGSFEKVVPENCDLLITASANNAATLEKTFKIHKAKSADDVHDLGELKLKEGTKVSGVVLDLEGEPVEGQVIRIQQMVIQNGFMQSQVEGHAVSDADGKFELPPREGKCDISLVKRASIKKKIVEAKGEVLMAKAVSVTLKAGTPAEDIEIRESKTWKIYGVINYEGEKPNVSTQNGSHHQNMVTVEDDGSFEFEVVDGAKGPYMIIYSFGTEVKMALLSRDSRKKFRKHFSNSLESESRNTSAI